MSDISPIPVDPRYPISKYVLDCDRNSSGNAHTPIANFYVVGKPNFSSFKDGITPIIYLAAVQIFRNPGVENSEYLLLHCAPDQSLLGVKCPDTTTPSGLAWTLTGDGNRLSVEPSVDLSLKIPCPLMWLNLNNSLEPIHFSITLEQTAVSAAKPLDVSVYGSFYFNQLVPTANGGTTEALNSVPIALKSNRKLLAELFPLDFESDLWDVTHTPYLLKCGSFCTTRPKQVDPLPFYKRKVSFEKSPENLREYSLGCSLRRSNWPSAEPNLYFFAPFNVPLLGSNNVSRPESFDIKVFMNVDLTLLESVEQWRNYSTNWSLHLWWRAANTVANEFMTPLKAWNQYVLAPYTEALKSVKGASCVSALPQFNVNDRATKDQEWLVSYALHDSAPLSLDVTGSNLSCYVLSLVPTADIQVGGCTPMFVDHSGQPLQFTYGISDVASSNLAINDYDLAQASSGLFTFSFPIFDSQLTGQAISESRIPQLCRAGSLDLDFAQSLQGVTMNSANTYTYVKTVLRRADQPNFPVDSLDSQLAYRIDSVTPASQDPTPYEYQLPEDLRPRSLVIPFPHGDSGQTSAKIPGPFSLVFTESASRQLNHEVSLSIERIAPVPNQAIDVVVLDFKPMALARVTGQSHWSSNSENQLAAWIGDSPERSSWQIEDDKDGCNLILPPQVIGEEFLENYDQLQPGRPLKFCLSPNATFTVSRTPFAANYSESPWNLRRLMGYPGQTTPGSRLQRADFELLYGLNTQITGRGLWLAELNSLMGELKISDAKVPRPTLVDPQVITKAIQQVKDNLSKEMDRYHSQVDSVRSRVASFRIHDADFSEIFELSDGVIYKLRPNRRSRAYYIPRTDDTFAGGADFGIAPESLLHKLEQQTSSAGKIVNPQFSPLGGNGFQKATFMGGNVSVYSNTSFGRTFYYSVEVLGRCAIMHNLLKHVVVYERSVSSSQQFQDNQKKFSGRPIVRRVSEYIEVLEPIKDLRNGLETGFVINNHFSHKIIPIDSAWREDIDANQYIIPLHSLSADQTTYPRPQIALKLGGHDGNSSTVVPAEFTRPDQLFFYTCTNQTGSPSSWAPVTGIDHPTFDLANYRTRLAAQTIDTDTSADLTSSLPGLANFTFTINTNEIPVNLVHNRQSNGVLAVLENVSLLKGKIDVHSVIDKTLFDAQSAFATATYFANQSTRSIQKALVNGADFKTKAQQFASNWDAETAKSLDLLKSYTSAQVATAFYDKLKKVTDISVEANWQLLIKEISNSLVVEQDAVAFANSVEQDILEFCNHQFRTGADCLLNNLQACRAAVKQSEDTLLSLNKGITDDLADVSSVIDANQNQAAINDFLLSVIYRLCDQLFALKQRVGDTFPQIITDAVIMQGTDRIGADLLSGLSQLSVSLLKPGLKAADIEHQLSDYQKSLSTAFGTMDGALDSQINVVSTNIAVLNKKHFGNGSNLQNVITTLKASIKNAASVTDKASPKNSALVTNPAISAALNKAFSDINSKVFPNFRNDVELTMPDNLKLAIFGNASTTSFTKEVRGVVDLINKVVQKIVGVPATLTNLTKLCAMLSNRIESSYLPLRKAIEKDVRSMEAQTKGHVTDIGHQLARAFGEAPIGKGLELDLDHLGYAFPGQSAVLFTRANVLLNKGVEETTKAIDDALKQTKLNPLSINLPCSSLLDSFQHTEIPPISRIRLSDILPKFVGIDFGKLPSLQAPLSLDNNLVKITHGIDPNTKQAWAKGLVDIAMSEPLTIFDLDPIKLNLDAAQLDAECDVAITAGGAPAYSMHGSLKADWKVIFNKTLELVQFKATTLRTDNTGNVSFDLNPANIVLTPPLNFLSDLAQKAGSLMDGPNGLSFQLIKKSGSNIPIGAQALLTLALPAVSTGAFSISNLTLHSALLLKVDNGFKIGTSFGIAGRDKPFTLIIMFLGGGGWVTFDSFYDAQSGAFSASLDIGIAAAASFALDIGVARGSVYLYVKVDVLWQHSSGQSSFDVSLEIAVSGELVILSIVSASLLISLTGTYHAGAGGTSLTCTGRLEVSIRICWCFSISVSKSVTINLIGKNNSTTASTSRLSAGVQNSAVNSAVDKHLASFGG